VQWRYFNSRASTKSLSASGISKKSERLSCSPEEEQKRDQNVNSPDSHRGKPMGCTPADSWRKLAITLSPIALRRNGIAAEVSPTDGEPACKICNLGRKPRKERRRCSSKQNLAIEHLSLR
jgi:hypothetical protein